MGRNRRDTSDTLATKQHQESMPFEPGKGFTTSLKLDNSQSSSPDRRRRALIVGLATTPILLSLSSRSAMAQQVNCSALSSIILGGSAGELPPGFDHKNPDFLQNYYDTHCTDAGNGTGNATGNSGASGNSGQTGNSNNH